MQLITAVQIRRAVPTAEYVGELPASFGNLRYDSRKVEAGDLYFGLDARGDRALDYVAEAVTKGAAAIVVARARRDEIAVDVPLLLVDDPRIALSRIAAEAHDHPHRGMKLYGVTGTNGKTTTAWALWQVLKGVGRSSGLIGTLGVRTAEVVETGYTTPEAPELMESFSRLRREGVTDVVIEVSSHALALHRVDALRFDYAIFTNLTQDHLDFHGTIDDYASAKRQLFLGLDSEATAVVNIDDRWGAEMARECDATVITYGTVSAADLHIVDARLSNSGTTWTLERRGDDDSIRLSSNLLGEFNVANLTAVAGVALAEGVPEERLSELFSSIDPVPGRMERVDLGRGVTGVVDYAHTPDALEKLLQCCREICEGRLILVFGCGGDRDREKRPAMGKIASTLSDISVVTSDNPRQEDPQAIIEEILGGMNGRSAKTLVEVDRRKAISLAVAESRAGDLVVVAGKGHEQYQIIGKTRTSFDDREVLLRSISPPTNSRARGME